MIDKIENIPKDCKSAYGMAVDALMFFALQISHFKIPHYVIFVDSYPLTVSGKVGAPL